MLLDRPTETGERRIPLYRRPGFLRALSPIAVLVIWQLASASGSIPAKKLPAPSIPLFGLIPLFIIWFGIGEEP